jgi:hypothetical protein
MIRFAGPAALAMLVAFAAPAFAQAPNPPPAGAETAQAGPKTPLPSRDTPRAAQPGAKSAPKDPDWPCVQPKVATLGYGQMWAGPPLDDAMKSWRGDEAREDLVALLVARRTPIEQAKAAIADYAAKAGADANQKLTLLFAGVFDEINDQRSRVVTGIERFARKQRALSDRIKTESIRISQTQRDMAAQMSPDGQKDQETLDWDTRIYDERSQSLTYVCETPVILEQRAFDLAREIQGRLN